jgi:hypothetical protein
VEISFEDQESFPTKKPSAARWEASERPCQRCGTTFTPKRATQKNCSDTCLKKPFAVLCAAGCGTTFLTTTRRKVFCGPRCRETGAADRYEARKVAEFGDEIPADVQEVINRKHHWANRGGYAQPGRVPTPLLRAAVIERAEGLCELCGKPGRDVDHHGDGEGIDGLRYLCIACHAEKTDPEMAYYMEGEF